MKIILIEYFKWLVLMAALSYASIFFGTAKGVTVLLLFISPLVPVSRVRVSMLKQNAPIPPKKEAIKLVTVFSIPPILLGLCIGFETGIPENIIHVASLATSLFVVSFIPLIVIFAQFFSKSKWANDLNKYAN